MDQFVERLGIVDVEPIGRGGPLAVGSRFRATLKFDRYSAPAEMVVTVFEPPLRFSWRVEPTGGSKLDNIVETVTLDRVGDVVTRVNYQLNYDVPTVLGRVGERIAVRGAAERTAEMTTGLLRQRVLSP